MASTSNVRLEAVDNIEQISQQSIKAIYQDKKGFMWFGTQEGLNRYDGTNFYAYTSVYKDTSSISGNWINAITEDQAGNLWVATSNGVSRLNHQTDTFTRFMADGSNTSINDKEARHIIADSQGTIWVATKKGLNKYLANEQHFKVFNFVSNTENVDIYAMVEDFAGNLWLGTDNHGLFLFDPTTEKLTNIAKDFSYGNIPSRGGIRSLYIDSEQVLWIGSLQTGLFTLDLKKPIGDSAHSNLQRVTAWGKERVVAINSDALGTMWIGTSEGVFYQDTASNSFHKLTQPGIQFDNLLSTQVWGLYSDRSGLFWLGGFSGLSKWNTRTTQFEHYHENLSLGSSLVGNSVMAVASINPEQILIGSTKGADILYPKTGKVTPIPVKTESSDGINDDRVMSIVVVSEQEIWFGHRKSGAIKYNPVANTFKHYTHDPNDDSSLGSYGVAAIIKARDGTVWFGSFGGGLNKYVPETDSFVRYQHASDDISTISSDKIISLLEDKAGRIWVGTWDAGVNVFVPETETAFRLQNDKSNPASLSDNTILALFQDRDENIWIGTAGGGLNLLTSLNIEQGRIEFENYSTLNALPSNVVYGVLQDQEGFLWISTNKGLTKFNIRSRVGITYNKSDGLQDNEFNSGSFYQDSNGYLYFGGINGLTRFHPSSVKANPITPNIEFTAFQRLNEFAAIPTVQSDQGAIDVAYTDYLIGIEFAALDFTSPRDNQYKYKLEGFDTDWVTVRDERRAIYTNLPAGSYVFKVIASNSDGAWNMEGQQLTINVQPAPWFSWWAYCLYGLTILAMLYSIYWFYRRKEALHLRYQVELEQQVQARTGELRSVNEKLRYISITDELTGLHNRRYLSDEIGEMLSTTLFTFANGILDDAIDARSGTRLMAMMFDLDGFKPINDNYGHEAGDKVIVQVADLLKEVCGENGIVVRWGGDEYMIVAYVDSLSHAEAIAENIRVKVANHGFDVGLSNKSYLSTSIGFALYPFCHYAPHSVSWDQVHSLADQALYLSKAAGRDAWTGIAQSDKDLPLTTLNAIVPNLEHAIENKNVVVVSSKNLN
ncbi:MAG: two-component regulator propeller domain-containing protein [Glaciecola sp.]